MLKMSRACRDFETALRDGDQETARAHATAPSRRRRQLALGGASAVVAALWTLCVTVTF